MKITVPVSVGELLDKITILHIKNLHAENEYVKKELNDLIDIAKDHQVYLKEYVDKLYEVNSLLWNVEDELRKLEKEENFGENFIRFARSVYVLNDERAAIKKEINEKLNSEYQEVKIFK